MLTAGSGQALYGLATVDEVRHDGHDVVATHIEEDGVPPPFSDRHADVIVSAYPRELPPYDETLPSSERRRIRTLVPDELPLLAADLTFVRVNGGRAYSGLVDRDDEPEARRSETT